MIALRMLAFALALVLGMSGASAQTSWPSPGGAQAPGVVGMILNGSGLAVPISSSNPMPVTGSFSASLGGFTPSSSGARGTPISVTTADSSGTLPSGTVVVATNAGSNPMYCNVNGVAATTSDQLITASGGWFAFTIPSGITVLHCIATGGSTTANMVGGSGLPTGTGGGSGGSSGSVNLTQIGGTSILTGGVNGSQGVGGLAGTGTALSGNPVLMGGSDGTDARSFLTDTGGRQIIIPYQGTTALSATNGGYQNLLQGNAALSSSNGIFVTPTSSASIGVTQSTASNLNATVVGTGGTTLATATNQTNIIGSASGGTAAADSQLAGAIYNSSTPTLTNGQQASLQLTSAGSLHTTVDNTIASLEWNSDGNATTLSGSQTSSLLYAYNGTTIDRLEDDANKNLKVVNLNGPTSSSTYALSHNQSSSAGVTSLVIKSSAGNLYDFKCDAIAGAAAGYCIVYNGSSAPSTGSLTAANVLDWCYFGTTAAGCSLSRVPMPINYSTGIVVLISSASTPFTYTTGTDSGGIEADFD